MKCVWLNSGDCDESCCGSIHATSAEISYSSSTCLHSSHFQINETLVNMSLYFPFGLNFACDFLFAKLNWVTGLIGDHFRVITLLLCLEIALCPFQVNISNVMKQSPGFWVVMTGWHRKKIQRMSPSSTVSFDVFRGYVSLWQCISSFRKEEDAHYKIYGPSYTARNDDFKMFLQLKYLFKRNKKGRWKSSCIEKGLKNHLKVCGQ